MGNTIRIGTRESQLATWQATHVKDLLEQHGFASELVFIKSEGDIDLQTPLYEMGVHGIFTRSLDIALLNKQVDIAVHSMKDVPTRLPAGLTQAAVLKRGAVKDLLVYKQPLPRNDSWSIINADDSSPFEKIFSNRNIPFTVATSSIRRKAQWLYRFPNHTIENLRGNVNTRLKKLRDENWDAAIFAQAGLERINLRPETSVELEWMLPAPAQGAIMIVCREDDTHSFHACSQLNDANTELCTKIERDFLRALLGGCTTPISALATVENGQVFFRGNMLTVDGKQKTEITLAAKKEEASELGIKAGTQILRSGESWIDDHMRNAGK